MGLERSVSITEKYGDGAVGSIAKVGGGQIQNPIAVEVTGHNHAGVACRLVLDRGLERPVAFTEDDIQIAQIVNQRQVQFPVAVKIPDDDG